MACPCNDITKDFSTAKAEFDLPRPGRFAEFLEDFAVENCFADHLKPLDLEG